MRPTRLLTLLAVLAAASAVSAAATIAATPTPDGVPPHVLLGRAGPQVAPAPGGGPACTATNSAGVTVTLPCFYPAVLKEAYDFPTGSSAPTGAGQTIVIVVAYGSPTIREDVAAFDAAFGIPAPQSLTIVEVPGTCTGPPDCSGEEEGAFGWGLETSLDVEYAHAIAPGARLVLVVAGSDSNNDLVAAEAAVLPRYPGAIVSQSFGDWETDGNGAAFAAMHKVFLRATLAGSTLLASSGDVGATWTPFTGTTFPAIASYPASDPLVLAVGGTMGDKDPTALWKKPGRYGGERVWNEPDFDQAAGAAPSVLFDAPSWQRGLTRFSGRTVPDVSYYAGIEAGVVVIYSPFAYLVGGTSAGPPQWAGILALANELRGRAGARALGFASQTLYQLGSDKDIYKRDFNDVKKGDNALDSPLGFEADHGFDVATGFGTPDVKNLLRDLARVPGYGLPVVPEPKTAVADENRDRHGRRHSMRPGE